MTMNEDAENAAEAIRTINHTLSSRFAVPAPEVYGVLSELKLVAYRFPQALTSLAEGLAISLDEYDVYDNAGEPASSVAACNASLQRAAMLLAQAGEELEKAQSALSSQGYRD
ncbi:hypothetical protein [Hoyosella subflava]|uniref:Uncharacterized protein n=1 Tax=Hoyosella subflava (strain DSM 45089 / JCM 17490 / NBRC 109087 / DQS3-9A1) TaxID=443218 RepID=F6ESL1_HOYSD|nr:hypothetical protein [Hoyosella subflava]AEF43132.1 hypothetical protein AS9A_P20088 [Hoyosella subflava DQS3-9A1]